MLPLDAFSPDYKTARSRFREMAAARHWPLESHDISATGFADGELTIDVAHIGSKQAERVIVISSGVHGGEGPFGSAVQLAWIDSLPLDWQPPPGCAVVLIHAINPYGYAALRRANEDNVDLNRNFLDEADFARLKARTADEFAPLDPHLNPAYPPGAINWAPLIFVHMRLTLGAALLADVLPAGQYAFPKGIFFGGDQTCRSTNVMMSEMPRWLGAAKSVIHLDYHTGLGRYGEYKLLLSSGDGSDQERLARSIFGHDRVESDQRTEGGYHNHGDMGDWLNRRFADQGFLYLCAEFGTFGAIRVIGSLRRENQAHYWEPPDSARYREIKDFYSDTFVPRSSAWRWTVVRKSLQLIQTALRYCATAGNSNSKFG